MPTVNFSQLYKLDYSLSQVVTFYQFWTNNSVWATAQAGRPDNGLMLLTNCELDYFSEQREFTARLGDISYIPQGSVYTCKFKNCAATSDVESASSLLINFVLTDEENRPLRLSDHIYVFSPQNSAYYQKCFREILALSKKGDAPPARIKALLYNLLTDISLELRKEVLIPRHFAQIYDGILFMENNYTSKLSVPALSELCHVSESCFRRLFRQYSGMSVWEYIIHLRIAKARMYLESGMLTVKQTAALVGFDDPAYFSRLFKKKTGLSPSEILDSPQLHA
mgnify:CR=1 FL=1